MDFMLTKEQLKSCIPLISSSNLDTFTEPLNKAMDKYFINNPKRIAAFLAQLAHESGSFKYVEEIASGIAYENRKDLGNIEVGDGKKFKGRGLIQITGRSNYKSVGKALGYDFISNPEALELPGPASFSAAWFWFTHGLNELADKGEFLKITKRINGGTNGLKDRVEHWERCKKVLHVQ
jgi:putative chitinase